MALAASASAIDIIYKVGGEDEDSPRPWEYLSDPRENRMVFRWPHVDGNPSFRRCNATMISAQVAITSARCIRENELDTAFSQGGSSL